MNNINKKINNATKWSIFTEIIVKIISPITNLILARLLAPEAFGVVATVTMITSFSDLFTDAGFSKFLIQRKFNNQNEQDEYTCVAFWSNLIISIIIWLIISIFADKIAILVGNDGLGNVIRIASFILVFTSFSSIQTAVFRKNFNFKILSFTKITSKLIPFVVTIPLALLGYSYWALIIGNLVGELVNAIILTTLSVWKPKFKYELSKLKDMITFCGWNFMEVISGWLVSNIGIFIIGIGFSSYYLGIYKGAITTIGQIVSIISASTINVLFTSLSTLQDSEEEYNKVILKFQKIAGFFSIPLGVGIFIFREFITFILLGNQWIEASFLVGLWGFIIAESIIFADFGATIILSKGKPKLLFISNAIQIMILVPVLLWCLNKSFSTLVVMICLVRIQLPLMQLFWIRIISGIKLVEIYNNIKGFILCAIIMGLAATFMKGLNNSIICNCIYIVISLLLYIILNLLIPENFKIIKNFYCELRNKKLNTI